MELKLSHRCIVCKKKILSEKVGIRLAPDGVLDQELARIKTRDLGQWVHPKACFTKYFKALDRQRAIK